MPRYYFHLRDGTDVALDEEGTDHADGDALQAAVLAAARDCISGDLRSSGLIDLRLRIDAEDSRGEVVYSLPFADAVTIVPGDAPVAQLPA
jgi:hypothetical protein